MPDESENIADRHRRVCKGFGDEVSLVGDQWQSQSPCGEWDARGVLEHVIGFHDVLLLRPMGEKPQRPKGDPVGRWSATFEALDLLLSRPGLFDRVVDVPRLGNNPPSQIDAARIVPLLSLEVLVHTWPLSGDAEDEVYRGFFSGPTHRCPRQPHAGGRRARGVYAAVSRSSLQSRFAA
jgi:hypothetical protein